MMWFEIVAGKNAGQRIPIPSEADRLQIGCSHEAAVYLDSTTVAPEHAAFIPGGGGALNCCQVRQGFLTRMNGQPTSPPFTVLDHDEIQLGEFVLRFRSVQDELNRETFTSEARKAAATG